MWRDLRHRPMADMPVQLATKPPRFHERRFRAPLSFHFFNIFVGDQVEGRGRAQDRVQLCLTSNLGGIDPFCKLPARDISFLTGFLEAYFGILPKG